MYFVDLSAYGGVVCEPFPNIQSTYILNLTHGRLLIVTRPSADRHTAVG